MPTTNERKKPLIADTSLPASLKPGLEVRGTYSISHPLLFQQGDFLCLWTVCGKLAVFIHRIMVDNSAKQVIHIIPRYFVDYVYKIW